MTFLLCLRAFFEFLSIFCRSETRPPEDDEEEEEEILGSDDDEQEDPKDYVKGKVPVFYCLMKKFKSLNFYQKIFSLILTNLDQTHRDLLKITTKNFW